MVSLLEKFGDLEEELIATRKKFTSKKVMNGIGLSLAFIYSFCHNICITQLYAKERYCEDNRNMKLVKNVRSVRKFHAMSSLVEAIKLQEVLCLD